MEKTAKYFSFAVMIVTFCAGEPAWAGVISKSTVKVTQLKIEHSGGNIIRPQPVKPAKPGVPPSQPTAWGIFSNYVGPGDINRLRSVDIYLDSYNRISTVKIIRESYTGDIVTSIFTGVREFSVQTLKPGARRPYKQTTITIRTAFSAGVF